LNPRRQRLLLIFAGLGVLGLIAALVLNALRSNLVFFFSPSQVVAGEAPGGGTGWSRKKRSGARPMA